jgi:hypothetical protein
MRLAITARGAIPGSKVQKPFTTALSERAMPEASHNSTIGASMSPATSALEPLRSVGLAPSNKPITPSIRLMSARAALRANVVRTASGPISQLSRLCTTAPLAFR